MLCLRLMRLVLLVLHLSHLLLHLLHQFHELPLMFQFLLHDSEKLHRAHHGLLMLPLRSRLPLRSTTGARDMICCRRWCDALHRWRKPRDRSGLRYHVKVLFFLNHGQASNLCDTVGSRDEKQTRTLTND